MIPSIWRQITGNRSNYYRTNYNSMMTRRNPGRNISRITNKDSNERTAMRNNSIYCIRSLILRIIFLGNLPTASRPTWNAKFTLSCLVSWRVIWDYAHTPALLIRLTFNTHHPTVPRSSKGQFTAVARRTAHIPKQHGCTWNSVDEKSYACNNTGSLTTVYRISNHSKLTYYIPSNI